MVEQFKENEISKKAKRALRELGGKVSQTQAVTFPAGTQVESKQVLHWLSDSMIEQRIYSIPGGSVLVYHPQFGLYVDKFVGIYEG